MEVIALVGGHGLPQNFLLAMMSLCNLPLVVCNIQLRYFVCRMVLANSLTGNILRTMKQPERFGTTVINHAHFLNDEKQQQIKRMTLMIVRWYCPSWKQRYDIRFMFWTCWFMLSRITLLQDWCYFESRNKVKFSAHFSTFRLHDTFSK